jgi:hypothetical protein
MIAVQPRHFVYRGSILASGFIIRSDLATVGETRRRVLDLWQPGLRVKAIDSSLIAILPVPTRVIVEQAVGDPLVRSGSVLIALPLEPDEIQALAATNDSLVFAKAGQIQKIELAELPDEDPARWIDIASITIADVVTLGAPPERPAFEAPAFDPRRNIPGVPPASSELQGLLAELRKAQGGRDRAMVRTALVSLRESVTRLWEFMRRFRFRSRPRKQMTRGTSQHASPRPGRRRNRLGRWLGRGINQVVNFTRLSRVMFARHARYLSRMMAMMQSGDIDEGLRHAIPLADATKLVSRDAPSLWSWFRLPRRRPDLSIHLGAAEPRPAWALGGQMYNHLRDLYRQAFQRLEAQGRIEEAAFVLTELLAVHAEAVSFLEKHGRLRLAAEIAEARKLNPAIAIRLWWLAKERKRAISLACRTGEFEQAIQHLAGHQAEADQLRLVWAGWLALSGRYLAAAEAVWPLNNERDLVIKYLDQAFQAGGTAAAIALARKGARFPQSFADVLPAAETLMAEENEESARARSAFAESLRKEPVTSESLVLARLATRALVRDVQQGTMEMSAVQLRRLVDFTGDPCLRADVPPIQRLKPESPSEPPSGIVEVSASDIGLHPVADLALLPDGRLLVALGEAGLMLLSREGRQIAQWNQPAQRLVVSDDGTRVLGMARRDRICRLIRFDVLARKAAYWCDTRITEYTDNFDGSAWCIADGEDLYLIDTLAQHFEPLWRVPDLGGKIVAMRRNRKENRLHVVTENPKLVTSWTFDHPSCNLRAKREFESDLDQFGSLLQDLVPVGQLIDVATSVSEEGDIFEQWTFPTDGPAPALISQIQTNPAGTRKLIGKLLGGRLQHAAARGRWIAIPVRCEDYIQIVVFDPSTGVGNVFMKLHGAKQVVARFADDVLVCGDDQGRILAVNLTTRKTVRDLRL